MSELLNKSEENLNAGIILRGKEMFASSIHCYYYGCLLMIKYILLMNGNKKERELDEEQKNSEQTSHNWLINTFYSEYKKINSSNALMVRNKIFKLKKHRVNADYKDMRITDSISKTSEKFSQEILTIMKRDYKI